MNLERISPQHTSLYKAIRLTALATDPLAFGSIHAREVLLSDREWEARAASLDGEKRVGFLAMQGGTSCGLVLCSQDADAPGTADVLSMWVAPSARRGGVGSRLLEAVRAWAESRGVETLRLLVTEGNDAAITLYERNGYRKTGRTDADPNRPDTLEVELSRPVAGTANRTTEVSHSA